MPLRAAFIGVNRHSDPHIGDLTGAVSDATALWALFSDSVPGLDAHRLLDEGATLDAVRRALDDVLGAAEPDDTCVLFFAGHGTPAHQIVPHDADASSVASSTLPMEELAERLRTTRARASLIVLDCCFSGGAPARVFSEVPIPRSGAVGAEQLGGRGRVVLAASRDDEPALELGRHGLFTRALLDAISDAGGAVDVGTLMPDVARRVAAESARLGASQTPVWAGLVEGGLTLPALHPGAHFAAAFPDTSGVRVSADIADLTAFGLPEQILGAWAAQFPSGLNPLQLSAVNDFRVLDGDSLLVVAPTTAGKTFIGELAAAKALADGRKAVFVLPFRALVNEKYDDFKALYGDALGYRVLRCTGDFGDDVDPFVRGKYDVAVLTFEMFLRLSVGVPGVLNKLGLVVVDEAQFATDATRGINVELLLTNLLSARERGVAPQIVALSAVIGDVNAFDEWLGCKALVTTERPVPLVEGVLDRSGTYQSLGPDGVERTEQFLSPGSVVTRGSKPSAQDVIVPLVQRLVQDGEHVIVFRNTRGSAAGCANYLAQELGLPPAADVLAGLPTQDPSRSSGSLVRALSGGTAFHTTDLTRDERVAVERAFRDPEGPVRALAATSTVAAGVNTPASTVVIVETFFYGDGGPVPYSVAAYKNMAGRAGRLGITKHGRSVLIADSPYEREVLFERYVRSSPEPMRSSFSAADLSTWVLRLLSQVGAVAEADVSRLLANTYGGYLASRADPQWRAGMEAELAVLLARMDQLGLVEVEAGQVQLSLLGSVCGRSSLSFPSAVLLVERLRGPLGVGLTPERLMAVVQALPESDSSHTPLFKRGTKESQWQQTVTSRLGADTTFALQRGAADQFAYWARCKRTAILLAWTDGAPIQDIEATFSATPFAGSVSAGYVRSLADTTRYHLRSAFEVADVLLLGAGPDEAAVARLLDQLETGLPTGALGLLGLDVRLTRGEALALYGAGILSPEDVRAAGADRVRSVAGATAAAALFPEG